MKYKVGDKVRIREDLEVGKIYGRYFNKEMAKLKGKVVEIKDVGSNSYCIDGYYWTDEMFSGHAEESRNLIPLIAKELGVEMGEEFKISNKPDVYKFTEEGLIGIDDTYNAYSSGITFSELIIGKESIIKLPKKPKLTEDEKAILRNMPKKYKYIARDYWGELYIYENKPKKGDNRWIIFGSDYFNNLNMFQHLFQFIKWEDKEPYNIQELLEEYEKQRSE
jgi:hypothetical protein